MHLKLSSQSCACWLAKCVSLELNVSKRMNRLCSFCQHLHGGQIHGYSSIHVQIKSDLGSCVCLALNRFEMTGLGARHIAATKTCVILG